MSGEFYSLDEIKTTEAGAPLGLYPDTMFVYICSLSPDVTTHYRSAYNIMSLLSDIGGVMEILVMVAGVFMQPITFHLFFIKYLENLFLAKTF